ncbi:MAG TPA: L-glutamate gamma-semialdehyde dehydrogenase, partial [Paracoccus sp. (in: a-proteobacteria)]|nr:L-glutamate gamma-semialdehyde dehydrogenase [Paracoccus sp. (in: a-proteobacteria)]
LYEANAPHIFALLAREAGKTWADAVNELREAVDFLRYYAAQAPALRHPGRGIFAAISPWNFPLAIFTGQIAGALAAGNAVVAKPAEQTPLIASLAVQLMHRAGVPVAALQLLPGDGATVGAALTSDPRVSGVVFTGGTDTAQAIRRAMAPNRPLTAALIAETGGLNAMIVDSTALPEQAVRDILASGFQSAGQRCSALRCLYLQQDIAGPVLHMLTGAMRELTVGDPALISTDVGPVIDADAVAGIRAHIDKARAEGRVIAEMPVSDPARFVGPTLIRVESIREMEREIFGPVIHVATFPADGLNRVVNDINATGYGLTFGMHSRIESRVDRIAASVHAGNCYVNRNQIGAVVGSQPFGGEGLSGTGPKAGGPAYLARFTDAPAGVAGEPQPPATDAAAIQSLIDRTRTGRPIAGTEALPGPTGESNRLSILPRDPVLCLGPGYDVAKAQAAELARLGGAGIALDRLPEPAMLTGLRGFSGAVWWGDEDRGRAYARALAARPGPILPLIGGIDAGHAVTERHLCIDTTASGGNAALLSGEALGAASLR